MKDVPCCPFENQVEKKTAEVVVHVIEDHNLPINIEYNGMIYRLSKTKNNKLLLTK